MNNNYASVEDLAIFWRELSENERQRAEMLLKLASNILRGKGASVGVDVDAEKNKNTVFAENLKWVILEAVKRALQTPQDTPPVNSYSQTAGPYSENFTYTNPSGDLWFKKSELQILGFGGVQKISSINLYKGE